MTIVSYDKITEWNVAKIQLDHWKETEAELRRYICGEMLGDQSGHAIVKEIYDLGEFRTQVKATGVTNLSLDEEMLYQLHSDNLLTDKDNECFEKKIVIVQGNLKKIPKDSNVWRAITEKQGMPKLEVKIIETRNT